MSDQLAERKSPLYGNRGIVLRSWQETWNFAVAVKNSGMAPQGLGTTEKIAIAIQMGAELGLQPMTALSSIAVVNGRPSLWGDGLVARARNTGLIKRIEQWWEIDGKEIKPSDLPTYKKAPDSLTCVYAITRADTGEVIEGRFSVAQAKDARLWDNDKKPIWRLYYQRMMLGRSRGFAIKDGVPEALSGFMLAEEAQDLEPQTINAEVVSRSDELAAQLEQPKDENVPLPVSKPPKNLLEAVATDPEGVLKAAEAVAKKADRTLTADEQDQLQIQLEELVGDKWRNTIVYATKREAKIDTLLLSEREKVLEVARGEAKKQGEARDEQA